MNFKFFYTCISLLFLAESALVAQNPVSEIISKQFEAVSVLEWKEALYDPCTDDWTRNWTLDGLKANVVNGKQGMEFSAGPVRKEDSSHAVLWTKEIFEGDICIEYEYTRLDQATEAVNILYIQATGSGAPGYDTDITQWAFKRQVPSMRLYFNHMNTLHVSYAAFGTGNRDTIRDYVRARRYLPERQDGLSDTDLEPDYFDTELFNTGVPHRITVIKKGNDLFMHVCNSRKEMLFHWKTDALPPVTGGRIGLRHMWTRSARYSDFRISLLR